MANTPLPAELVAALEKAGLAEYFANCTAAHRREYLQWITDAKRPETRSTRILKAVEMLRERRQKESSRSGTKRATKR